MKPVWIPVRGEEVWRLVLETDWVDVDSDFNAGFDTVAGNSKHTHQLETDFAMPALHGWMLVKDCCRGTQTVEGGEWEVVEA